MSRPTRISALLALGALLAVVIAPPEAWGSGRMLLILAATSAFGILIAEGHITSRYLMGGAALFVLLAGHSLLLSTDPYRSFEFLGLVWAYYCLIGVFRYYPGRLLYPGSALLVALAAGVSLYGLYQFVWGFDQLHAFVESSGAADTIRLPILGRIDSARVFSTFVLPGTLWGFLLLSLPLHGIFWTRKALRPLLGVSAGLVLTATVLTQSYGFVAGLLVVILGWAFTRPGPRAAGRAVRLTLMASPLLAGAAGLLYLARVSTHNPVWLRLQNWLAAWEMFATHPLGSGLNTYATLYLAHQQPGANETQFAHNTPVQLVAELGVFGLALLLLGLLWLARNRLRLLGLSGPERCLLIALMVWGVHNLIDIDVYFGSIGAVGAALVGLFFCRGEAPPATSAPPSRALLGVIGAIAAVALVSSGFIYVSGEFLVRARTELELFRTPQAADSLRIAARINPLDPAIQYEAGQTHLELYHRTGDTAHLDVARSDLERAIRLSPNRVGPHVALALILASQNQTRESIDQLETAQMLDPQGAQAVNIRRMIEQRPPQP